MSYNEEGHILAGLGQDASTPIAIVGISGRFPGDATSPDKLWDMVTQKRSARTDVPKNRYNIDAFYHPSADHQGTTSARGGHFLKDDVAAFDAPFFKITAQEAHAMDPQQRMALELSYEALESGNTLLRDRVVGKTNTFPSWYQNRRRLGVGDGLLHGLLRSRLCCNSGY